VTSSNSQRIDGTTNAPNSPSAATTTSPQLTDKPSNSLSSPTPTNESTGTQSLGDSTTPGGGLVGSFNGYNPSTTTSNTVAIAAQTSLIPGFTLPATSPRPPIPWTNPLRPPPIAKPANTLPVVLPSAFVMIFAVVAVATYNRRKWVSQAYRRLSRTRRLRRPLPDASHDGDLTEDASPLRDLETPPPAYSPHRASWADQESLGDSYPMGNTQWTTVEIVGSTQWTALEIVRNMRWAASDAVGQAYPMEDRSRHGST
jgi:hypothetical protein